jgi:hypothetical protein
MHISIGSALGRDIRLNRIGETINSIAVPAAAYSLRSLTGGDPLAVRVRRQGTGEEDFTVSQINSGALVDYVNTNGVFANTGYESFSNASTSGFTASNTGSTGFAVSDLPDGTSGTAISVSFDISITNGSPSISLRTALNGGSSASNSVNYTSSGSKTATLTATGSYVGIGFTEGDAPSNFTVSNFKILGKGFVSIWYDQSGNSNDATQTNTGKQPEIVSSGSLIVDSAGLPEIDFDGSDDCLTSSSYSRSGEDLPLTMISVFDQDVAGIEYIVALNKTDDDAFDRILLRTDRFEYGRRATDNINKAAFGSDPDVNTKYVFTAINAGTTSSGFVNGSSIFSGVNTNVNTQALDQIDIGANNGDSQGSTNAFDGQIQEIIIYETDQSSNRTALETNIMNHYSIS